MSKLLTNFVSICALAGAEVSRKSILVCCIKSPEISCIGNLIVLHDMILSPLGVAYIQVRMLGYILIELLGETITLGVKGTLPVLFLVRNITKVYTADDTLALFNILIGNSLRSALQDIVHQHENCGAAHACVAVVMEPRILRKLLPEVKELVNISISRTEMVLNRNAEIVCTVLLNHLLLVHYLCNGKVLRWTYLIAFVVEGIN